MKPRLLATFLLCLVVVVGIVISVAVFRSHQAPLSGDHEAKDLTARQEVPAVAADVAASPAVEPPAPSSPPAAAIKLPDSVYTSNHPEAPPSALAAQIRRAVELQRGEPVLNADGSATRVRMVKPLAF